jgi:hypothetical protein
VEDVRHGSLRICGHTRKESLLHAIFELDPNYAFPQPTGATLLHLLPFFLGFNPKSLHFGLHCAEQSLYSPTDFSFFFLFHELAVYFSGRSACVCSHGEEVRGDIA